MFFSSRQTQLESYFFCKTMKLNDLRNLIFLGEKLSDFLMYLFVRNNFPIYNVQLFIKIEIKRDLTLETVRNLEQNNSNCEEKLSLN